MRYNSTKICILFAIALLSIYISTYVSFHFFAIALHLYISFYLLFFLYSIFLLLDIEVYLKYLFLSKKFFLHLSIENEGCVTFWSLTLALHKHFQIQIQLFNFIWDINLNQVFETLQLEKITWQTTSQWKYYISVTWWTSSQWKCYIRVTWPLSCSRRFGIWQWCRVPGCTMYLFCCFLC